MVLDSEKDTGFEFMKRISGFKWSYNVILSNMGYGALILGSIGFSEMLIRQILINKFSFSSLTYGLFLHGLIGSLIGLLSGVVFLYSFSIIIHQNKSLNTLIRKACPTSGQRKEIHPSQKTF